MALPNVAAWQCLATEVAARFRAYGPGLAARFCRYGTNLWDMPTPASWSES